MAQVIDIDGVTGAVIISHINNEDSKDTIKPPSESTGAQNDSVKEVEKAQITITEEFIEGQITFLPSPYIKAKMVVYLTNLGKMFDGKYYIKSLTKSMSSGDYSVTASVLRIDDDVPDTTNDSTREEPVKLPEPVLPDEPQYKVITIKWGDTLWMLSRKYNTTVQFLADLNNIKNPDLIYAGASLKVPV